MERGDGQRQGERRRGVQEVLGTAPSPHFLSVWSLPSNLTTESQFLVCKVEIVTVPKFRGRLWDFKESIYAEPGSWAQARVVPGSVPRATEVHSRRQLPAPLCVCSVKSRVPWHRGSNPFRSWHAKRALPICPEYRLAEGNSPDCWKPALTVWN